MPRKAF